MEIDYVYKYFDMPEVVQCEKQGSWAIKIDKIVLDHGHGWWVQNSDRTLMVETWTFVNGVVQPIKIENAVMEDVVRWQLDFGTRTK